MSLLSKPMAAQTLHNARPPAQNRRLFARLGRPLLPALRMHWNCILGKTGKILCSSKSGEMLDTLF